MFFNDVLNQYNLEYLTQTENHLAIQTHHRMLELFSVYCFHTGFLYFPRIIDR